MNLLAFLGVALVLICTPGPDTMLTIRNAMAGGRRGGIATAAGVASGQLIWTLAAAIGLGALLQTSPMVMNLLRFAGAAYLSYLGLRSLWATWRQPSTRNGETEAAALSPAAALRQGLLSNLANPKMVAFFLGLLPQFVLVDWSPFMSFILLGALFCLLTFLWLSICSVVLQELQTALVRPHVKKGLETAAGTILIVLGARLLTGK